MKLHGLKQHVNGMRFLLYLCVGRVFYPCEHTTISHALVIMEDKSCVQCLGAFPADGLFWLMLLQQWDSLPLFSAKLGNTGQRCGTGVPVLSPRLQAEVLQAEMSLVAG